MGRKRKQRAEKNGSKNSKVPFDDKEMNGDKAQQNSLTETAPPQKKKIYKSVRFNMSNTLVLRYFPITAEDLEAADAKLSKKLEHRKREEGKEEDEAAPGDVLESEESEADDVAGLLLPGDISDIIGGDGVPQTESCRAENEIHPLPPTADSGANDPISQSELEESDVGLLLAHNSASQEEVHRLTVLTETLEDQLRTTEEELDEATDALAALKREGGVAVGEDEVCRRKQSIDAMLEECEQLKEQVKMYQFLSTAQPATTSPEHQLVSEERDKLKSRVRNLEREVRSLEKSLAQVEEDRKQMAANIQKLEAEAEERLRQQASKVSEQNDSGEVIEGETDAGNVPQTADVLSRSCASAVMNSESESPEVTRELLERLVGELREQVTEEIKEELRDEIRAKLLEEMEQAVVNKSEGESIESQRPRAYQVKPIEESSAGNQKEVSHVSIHLAAEPASDGEKSPERARPVESAAMEEVGATKRKKGWFSCCF